MNWKTVLMLLLSVLLVTSVAAGCAQREDAAVKAVREQVAALPTVEQFQAMDEQQQLDAYNRTQEAYDAYMALSEDQKQQVEGAEEKFDALFSYYNSQIMPIGE